MKKTLKILGKFFLIKIRFKLCPTVGSDTDSTQMCVNSSLTCPINSIIESDRNPSPIFYKKGPDSLEGKSFYYSHLMRGLMPLTDLRLSEDSVCKKNNQTNISSGRKDSIFLKKQRKRCDIKDQDERFISLVNFKIKNFIFRKNSEKSISSLLTMFLMIRCLTTLPRMNINGNISLEVSFLSTFHVQENSRICTPRKATITNLNPVLDHWLLLFLYLLAF